MKSLKFIYLSVFQLFFTLASSCYSTATPSTAENFEKSDTITFIHVTDPHICNLTGYHPFFIQKRQHFGKNAEPFSQFLKSVPERQKADFLIITGDNIDYYEAQTEKGGMLDTQIEQYTRLLNLSEVPVYLTLGNHDIASYQVSSDLTYTNNQFHAERARAAWIRNAPCFKDGTYYSRVFNIDTTSFRLIFLDNGYYSTREISDDLLPFYIDQSQLLWLDDQLKTSASDVEIIFMHMPFPSGKPVDNSILTEPTTKYSPKSRFDNLLGVLEKNASTRLIFAGHKHINSINNYILPNENKLTQVMTGAFGYDPDSWRMIKITKNKIIVYSPGASKIEYIIQISK